MIIGSQAILYHFPDFKRVPKDYDIVAFDEYNKQDLIRIHRGTPNLKLEVLLNPVLLNWCKSEGGIPNICPKNELYTLKISHCFWDLENGSWNKHIWDIQWLKEKGCKFIPELFYQLYNYWEELHGKRKSSNLQMSAEDFFNNAIDYPIPHDDIHKLLIQHPYFKGQEQPTYVKILKEGQEVDVCMDKFSNLTEEEKFNVVFEEVAVMSLENRFSKKMYWKAKYERMLKKFITSHAKIEESLWIIQNHKKLLCNLPFNYEQFLNLEISKNCIILA